MKKLPKTQARKSKPQVKVHDMKPKKDARGGLVFNFKLVAVKTVSGP